MKTIAIVGRPNVGKSSLFNCLIKKKKAVISDIAGTTRDVRRESFNIDGDIKVVLSDTGGIEQKCLNELFEEVKNHAFNEAKKADLLFFVVDGKKPPLDEDRMLFRLLQSYKIPLFLVVNKIDNSKQKENIWEFYSFGTQNIYPISVVHNLGIQELKDSAKSALKLTRQDFIHIDTPLSADISKEIKIAIIGRVNVGKSSLLNALLGKNRSVVSALAGTTIDPIDETCSYKDKQFTFIDTAGLRRKGKVIGIEKIALLRTKEMLKESHIALLVLDASEPLVELDEKIASLVFEYGLGVIIVLNKWDIRYKDTEEIRKEIIHRFKYLSYAPIVIVSAHNKRKITTLKDKILEVFCYLQYHIPTSILNEVISSACKEHPIPSDRGKMVKIYYASQYRSTPPHISLVMNRPHALHFSYKRFLINRLRKNFKFEGVPIVLETRQRGERDKGINED